MAHSPDVAIREEGPGDAGAIRSINEAAFGRSEEADLIANLRSEGLVLASLVAEQGDQVVGHILFSRMTIETGGQPVPAVALAPIAVAPSRQRQGIGGDLIRRGLERLRANRERIVIVLGRPDYYSRFGFSTGKARAIVSPFPPEAFLALELETGALDGVRGEARYPAAFGVSRAIE